MLQKESRVFPFSDGGMASDHKPTNFTGSEIGNMSVNQSRGDKNEPSQNRKSGRSGNPGRKGTFRAVVVVAPAAPPTALHPLRFKPKAHDFITHTKRIQPLNQEFINQPKKGAKPKQSKQKVCKMQTTCNPYCSKLVPNET